MAYDADRDRFLVGVVQVQVEGSKSTLIASMHSYYGQDDDDGEPVPGEVKLSLIRKIEGNKRERITDIGRMTEAEAMGLFRALTPAVLKRAFEEANKILAEDK